jgi:hypothetical protein
MNCYNSTCFKLAACAACRHRPASLGLHDAPAVATSRHLCAVVFQNIDPIVPLVDSIIIDASECMNGNSYVCKHLVASSTCRSKGSLIPSPALNVLWRPTACSGCTSWNSFRAPPAVPRLEIAPQHACVQLLDVTIHPILSFCSFICCIHTLEEQEACQQ